MKVVCNARGCDVVGCYHETPHEVGGCNIVHTCTIKTIPGEVQCVPVVRCMYVDRCLSRPCVHRRAHRWTPNCKVAMCHLVKEYVCCLCVE